MEQTRRRITQAAIRLHTTIGPAATSLSAVAREAGVTRLTLYRHFADLDELFRACRSDWRAQNAPPDVASWVGIPVLETRFRTALAELYAWYADHGEELYPIYRDTGAMPASAQAAMKEEGARLLDTLLAGFSFREPARRRLRAAAGHALSFWTWRSLVVDHGLGDHEAVDLATRFVLATIPQGPHRTASGRLRRSRQRPSAARPQSAAAAPVQHPDQRGGALRAD